MEMVHIHLGAGHGIDFLVNQVDGQIIAAHIVHKAADGIIGIVRDGAHGHRRHAVPAYDQLLQRLVTVVKPLRAASRHRHLAVGNGKQIGFILPVGRHTRQILVRYGKVDGKSFFSCTIGDMVALQILPEFFDDQFHLLGVRLLSRTGKRNGGFLESKGFTLPVDFLRHRHQRRRIDGKPHVIVTVARIKLLRRNRFSSRSLPAKQDHPKRHDGSKLSHRRHDTMRNEFIKLKGHLHSIRNMRKAQILHPLYK